MLISYSSPALGADCGDALRALPANKNIAATAPTTGMMCN
ncbi:hypothetical protein LF41_1146 [Lysobacter dokdonensis DS-58]|uniref:Uncharacterized protein n=1 Tax=Lysobacter dokdonensis DS-58 TaxID=1300345 RepID=A0A0A2X5V5_9GAMM|nr:hypothetical protein LF41_1146 [Lysobacter dokdonensis DS-58]